MIRYFTHYWQNNTWDANYEAHGELLDHTAGNQFLRRGVRPGDFVYVITVKQGQLFVLGRLKIAEILDYDEALRRRGDVWEADEHLVGDPAGCSLQNYERPPVSLQLTQSLRFENSDGRPVGPKFVSPGILDQQTLRGVRELTYESARMLDKLIQETEPEVTQAYIAQSSTDYSRNGGVSAESAGHTVIWASMEEETEPEVDAELPEVDEVLPVEVELEVEQNEDAEELFDEVITGERLGQQSARVGQQEFSYAVRENYGNRCCFPGCTVAEDEFLRGAHIARWGDVPELRGKVSNGLCLCLMHDTAFELGFFTLTKNFRVAINRSNQRALTSSWCKNNLMPFEGVAIRPGKFCNPSEVALGHHWERIGFTPSVVGAAMDASTSIIKRGDRVLHAKFGKGIVLQSEVRGKDQELMISFEGWGTKKLMAGLANLQRL